jgi:hypothetical protein
MCVVPELRAFEGRWHLSRVIEDRRAQSSGQFEGRALFAPQAGKLGVLDYFETGEMSYAGQPPMAASRAYIWQQAPGGIAVLFDDGRPFHVIEDTRGAPDAVHHCDPDLYHVSYDFSRWAAGWRAVWRVQGPRKDYRMVSEYRRITSRGGQRADA